MDKKATRIETKQTRINRRADKKLEEVAESMKYSFGNRCAGSKYTYLEKKIFLQDFQFLKELKLNYKSENRLISISYNLIVSSEFDHAGVDNCSFSIKYYGKFSQQVKWICDNINADEKTERILNLLNDEIIVSRIKQLQIMCCVLFSNSDSGKLTIQCELMPGSSTWVLIPPVFQLISPQEGECRCLAELFDLLSAVANEIMSSSTC